MSDINPAGAYLRGLRERRGERHVESIELPGLRCPNCGRLAYDHGGGRACYSKPGSEFPTHCGVMEPVTLRAVALPSGRES